MWLHFGPRYTEIKWAKLIVQPQRRRRRKKKLERNGGLAPQQHIFRLFEGKSTITVLAKMKAMVEKVTECSFKQKKLCAFITVDV